LSAFDDLSEAGEPSVIMVTGELDILTSASLTRRFERALDDGARRIIVDLLSVTFFDSTGLRTIEDARAAAAGRGVSLVLVCTDQRLLRLFEITNLLALYEVFPSVEAATAG
jgi:anti-sigma B factor antagonist